MALKTNLVSYYKLDGNSNDAHGSNNGTDTSITYSAAKINNGASFNATGDKIVCGDTPFNFERTQPFSISVWIKRNSNSVNRFILAKQLASGNFTGWVLWQKTSNVINFELVSTPTNIISVSTTAITDTTNFIYITVTYDGSSSASGVKIYVNTSSETLTTTSDSLTTSILNNAQLEIGNRNGTFNYNGLIDEIGIWTRVLSASEVSELYNLGAGLSYDNFTGEFSNPLLAFNF